MTTDQTNKRGGPRPNAGRRAAVPLISKRFRLSAKDIAIADELGDGNQTLGVRKALSFADKHKQQLLETDFDLQDTEGPNE